MTGGLVDGDLLVGTPNELISLLEGRFAGEIEFELPAVERRIQLAVVLARLLQDRLIIAAVEGGWDPFAERAGALRRLTDQQRLFSDPEPWASHAPLVLVRPTTVAANKTPDGPGRVVMVGCRTDWGLLGSLPIADPEWFSAGRFDSSFAIRQP